MKNIRIAHIAIMLASAVIAATTGTADAAGEPAPPHPELLPVYEQFGGKQGLAALVDDFLANLLTDPRTSPFFQDRDLKHIKAELVDQFCTILGGPCTYTGKDMHKAHVKLGIRESNFNALIEDLQLAMDKHRVPFRAQNKLLAILAPMGREMITRPRR